MWPQDVLGDTRLGHHGSSSLPGVGKGGKRVQHDFSEEVTLRVRMGEQKEGQMQAILSSLSPALLPAPVTDLTTLQLLLVLSQS